MNTHIARPPIHYAGHIHCHLGVDGNCCRRLPRAYRNTNTNEKIRVPPPLLPSRCARKIADVGRLDDLFLGIGATVMVQTYIVGTILYGWVEELDAAIAGDNIVWILDNDHRIIAYWYSTSATYIFSIVPLPFWKKLIWEWFIKLGIAWFLCRLSNNIFQYGRWKNILFWY